MDRRNSPGLRGTRSSNDDTTVIRTPSPRGRGRGRGLSAGRGRSPLLTVTKEIKSPLLTVTKEIKSPLLTVTKEIKSPSTEVTPTRISRSTEQKKAANTLTPVASPSTSISPMALTPNTEEAESGKNSTGRGGASGRGGRASRLKGSRTGSNVDSQSEASDIEDAQINSSSRRGRRHRALNIDSAMELSETESLASQSAVRTRPGRKPGPKPKTEAACSDSKLNASIETASDVSDAESQASDTSKLRGRSVTKHLMEVKLSKKRNASIDSSDADSKSSERSTGKNYPLPLNSVRRSRAGSIDSSDAESPSAETRRIPRRPLSKQSSQDTESPSREVAKKRLGKQSTASPSADGSADETNDETLSTSDSKTQSESPGAVARRKPGRPFKSPSQASNTFKVPPTDESVNKVKQSPPGEGKVSTTPEVTRRKPGRPFKSPPPVTEKDTGKGTPEQVRLKPGKKPASPAVLPVTPIDTEQLKDSESKLNSDNSVETLVPSTEHMKKKPGRPFKSPPVNPDKEGDKGDLKLTKQKSLRGLASPLSSKLAGDTDMSKTDKEKVSNISGAYAVETSSTSPLPHTIKKKGRPFRSPPPSAGNREVGSELSAKDKNEKYLKSPPSTKEGSIDGSVSDTGKKTASTSTPSHKVLTKTEAAPIRRKPGRPFKSPPPNPSGQGSRKLSNNDKNKATNDTEALKESSEGTPPLKRKPGRPFKSPPPTQLESPKSDTASAQKNANKNSEKDKDIAGTVSGKMQRKIKGKEVSSGKLSNDTTSNVAEIPKRKPGRKPAQSILNTDRPTSETPQKTEPPCGKKEDRGDKTTDLDSKDLPDDKRETLATTEKDAPAKTSDLGTPNGSTTTSSAKPKRGRPFKNSPQQLLNSDSEEVPKKQPAELDNDLTEKPPSGDLSKASVKTKYLANTADTGVAKVKAKAGSLKEPVRNKIKHTFKRPVVGKSNKLVNKVKPKGGIVIYSQEAGGIVTVQKKRGRPFSSPAAALAAALRKQKKAELRRLAEAALRGEMVETIATTDSIPKTTPIDKNKESTDGIEEPENNPISSNSLGKDNIPEIEDQSLSKDADVAANGKGEDNQITTQHTVIQTIPTSKPGKKPGVVSTKLHTTGSRLATHKKPGRKPGQVYKRRKGARLTLKKKTKKPEAVEPSLTIKKRKKKPLTISALVEDGEGPIAQSSDIEEGIVPVDEIETQPVVEEQDDDAIEPATTHKASNDNDQEPKLDDTQTAEGPDPHVFVSPQSKTVKKAKNVVVPVLDIGPVIQAVKQTKPPHIQVVNDIEEGSSLQDDKALPEPSIDKSDTQVGKQEMQDTESDDADTKSIDSTDTVDSVDSGTMRFVSLTALSTGKIRKGKRGPRHSTQGEKIEQKSLTKSSTDSTGTDNVCISAEGAEKPVETKVETQSLEVEAVETKLVETSASEADPCKAKPAEVEPTKEEQPTPGMDTSDTLKAPVRRKPGRPPYKHLITSRTDSKDPLHGVQKTGKTVAKRGWGTRRGRGSRGGYRGGGRGRGSIRAWLKQYDVQQEAKLTTRQVLHQFPMKEDPERMLKKRGKKHEGHEDLEEDIVEETLLEDSMTPMEDSVTDKEIVEGDSLDEPSTVDSSEADLKLQLDISDLTGSERDSKSDVEKEMDNEKVKEKESEIDQPLEKVNVESKGVDIGSMVEVCNEVDALENKSTVTELSKVTETISTTQAEVSGKEGETASTESKTEISSLDSEKNDNVKQIVDSNNKTCALEISASKDIGLAADEVPVSTHEPEDTATLDLPQGSSASAGQVESTASDLTCKADSVCTEETTEVPADENVTDATDEKLKTELSHTTEEGRKNDEVSLPSDQVEKVPTSASEMSANSKTMDIDNGADTTDVTCPLEIQVKQTGSSGPHSLEKMSPSVNAILQQSSPHLWDRSSVDKDGSVGGGSYDSGSDAASVLSQSNSETRRRKKRRRGEVEMLSVTERPNYYKKAKFQELQAAYSPSSIPTTNSPASTIAVHSPSPLPAAPSPVSVSSPAGCDAGVQESAVSESQEQKLLDNEEPVISVNENTVQEAPLDTTETKLITEKKTESEKEETDESELKSVETVLEDEKGASNIVLEDEKGASNIVLEDEKGTSNLLPLELVSEEPNGAKESDNTEQTKQSAVSVTSIQEEIVTETITNQMGADVLDKASEPVTGMDVVDNEDAHSDATIEADYEDLEVPSLPSVPRNIPSPTKMKTRGKKNRFFHLFQKQNKSSKVTESKKKKVPTATLR